MFPFWDIAIAPVLEAARAKRIVEIGALKGETTARMLERLGADAELHVIDPEPDFDPTEHEKQFAGRYVLHQDISHNVLPELPPMDAALVDGDHNWYTVYHELKMISATARAADAPLPVLIMHDVCWPYGRRDLYYAPERIPEEFRQPYAQRGMRMNRKDLLPGGGGLNPTMFNAVKEGGPQNGVMTALDDFIAGYDRPLRRVVLPIYFGLAIVAEQERLDRQPELARVLEWLESNEGSKELLELAESTRLQAMVFQHDIFYNREGMLERAATRYLDLLEGALLDEHYLDNEVRINYLARNLERGSKPDPVVVRDAARYLKPELRELQAARRAGKIAATEGGVGDYFPYTTMGRVRLDDLRTRLDDVRTNGVGGDLVECGTERGGGAIFMRGYLEAHEMRDRTVWVADRFRATPESSATEAASANLGGGSGFPEFQGDLNSVRDGFSRFDLLGDRVRFLQGSIADTLADQPINKVALLRIGGGIEGEIGDALDALYQTLSIGGFVVVDQYAIPDVKGAVDDFRNRRGIDDPIARIDWVGAYWQKRAPARVAATTALPASAVFGRAPLAPPTPPARLDLSVIAVFYNMQREAARTLHSLSRAYQRGIDDLDYEVIVVENGSDEDQKLSEELVQSFGSEFRYLDLGGDATPSPAVALNRGVAVARGDAFAFMIDGAHVLTPGVLQFGMTGLTTYPPAIVATQQWYVGPGQQGDAMLTGYDQAFEDRLFEEIEWPANGYRLFDIGHFIGDRDWFDGVWESNCLFVPRRVLEQVGAFDETFSQPGGGYANLEMYERLGSAPDTTVVTIIGEGSFHQVHGGTTTNEIDTDERRRRIAGYAQHYSETRGRGFRGPGRTMHYVGSMHPRAVRTKARRRIAPNLFKVGGDDPDALPEKPLPIPEELKVEFVDAVWRSHASQRATWLGQPTAKLPTDLLAYQEIVNRIRPEWIVETGTGDGGRALFLASICELVGEGQVLSIDRTKATDRPQHPRITYMHADPVMVDTARRVREVVGEAPRALVILGSCGHRGRMVAEIEHYSPLVPLGSYLVIEETIVNGHPVWPSFGPGPAEAVKHVINTRGDFAPDPDMERYGLTFNPNGFLKRVQ